MFCQKCGNPLQPGERFCTKCGAPVEQPAAPQQPQQPQQQPQQAYQAPQQAPYQQPYQQPYQAPKAPMAKNKLFGLLISIIFGAAALFELIAMIGYCVKFRADAGIIISYIIIVLSCIGIAIAPFLKAYTKLCIAASGAALFLGAYGISMLFISGSFGFFLYMLGFACLALLCWLGYKNNNLLNNNKWLVFIPAGVIFVGALINWIVGKYFSMMKYAVVYPLFDFLFGLTVIGGAVILGMYLVLTFGEKGAEFKIPNPGAQPQRPQQPPYQGR